MRLLESAIQIAALAAIIWVLMFQLPRARREQDAFAVVCALLTGLIALLLWLFVGIRLQS